MTIAFCVSARRMFNEKQVSTLCASDLSMDSRAAALSRCIANAVADSGVALAR